ncbi:MAG: membrane protein insertion efficiency factor YidD [Parachlamydiaceae bacterium]
MKKLTLLLIQLFKAGIRPLLGPQACRFYPTCTDYALQAVEKHGALKGSFFALKRVLKCHPFSKGGSDPV